MISVEVVYFLAQLLFILALFALPLALIFPRAFAPLFGTRISRPKLGLILISLLLLSFLVAVATQVDYSSQINPPDPPANQLHEVTSVIDGDTIRVLIGGQIEVIRLIGIDAPEMDYATGEHECFAPESTARARELLDGKRVQLEADGGQGNRDTHDRWLRYVFTADGTNFNQLMLAEGYAYELAHDTPYKYQGEFRAAGRSAKEKRVGLWSPDSCNGQRTAI